MQDKESVKKEKKGDLNDDSDRSVEYVDDDIMDALENQPDNIGEGNSADSADSGFQTIDEGSTVKDDDSFIDGQINENQSDAICSFNKHQDSVYCVAVLEEPKKDGSLLLISGDGRDKAFVWTCAKKH
jgi:hypothetical protein